jgi:hypothetical protein
VTEAGHALERIKMNGSSSPTLKAVAQTEVDPDSYEVN